ncbi:ATP-grasp enzyme [Leptolyngbya sp. NIES-2104]|uniref:ATP-grasp enzyme n=1 Tax=Leptolyngbya sp. NIES-2104 TaxID=1552121 RepID=UPI00073E1DD4|nr:ATP-grasp enzyme [Leptolyngbya sp. NIES-2104]
MLNSKSLPSKLIAALQNILTLTALLIALPINLTIVLIAFLIGQFQKSTTPKSNAPKRILITGGKMTKALQLARSFHAAGHSVVLVETEKYWLTGHRFSNAVDRFYTVPAPKQNSEAFINALVEIVQRENIDFFVPVTSPVESYYCSLAKPELSKYCEVFHFDVGITQLLDDKFELSQKARSLNLTAPKTYQITNPQQVLDFEFDSSQYILKSIAYNSVHRLDMTKYPLESKEAMAAHLATLPISDENPWILQEFITGQEYCTHSTVRDGKVRLHCCAKSSAFQVNYEQVEHAAIQAWITTFVEALNLSGQISFDFIERSTGEVYAIECNPRTHSAITMFYNHPEVANAYLGEPLTVEPIQPLPTSKPTYWTYHEVWRLITFDRLQHRLQTILSGKDAILQTSDPIPFLMVHHWQIPLLLLNNLHHLKGWVRIDFNIGKLVEPGGD